MLKKKLVTRGIALMLILSSLLAGCGSSDVSKDGSEREAAGEPVAGGSLSFALATTPDSLDPHRSGFAVASRVIRTIHDSLVTFDEDGSVIPWLATSWTVSEDGKTYTFKLREDVKFHDGTPFNAEAVKYNYDRVISPETKAANALALLKPYGSSEIIDEYTIKVNLESPSRAFLGNLGNALLGIVSPAAAEKYGDQLGQNPVGTGPFIFEGWDEDIKVTRNPDYKWAPETLENQGAAYLDQITFKVISEEATRIGSVQSGEVDAVETVPPQNITPLKEDSNLNLLQVDTSGLPYTLFFNLAHEPWNDVKVRQAVQAAIDVEAIIKTLYLGTYEQAWSALTPGIFGYDSSLENSVKVDIEKANSLLDEQGWVKGSDGIREKDGKKLTLHYVDASPNREKRNDIAVIVQQQLKEIGVEVNVEIIKDVYNTAIISGNYDIFGNSQVNTDPNALRPFYHSESGVGKNLAALSDPQVDEWLDEGTGEADDTKRAEIYKNVQQYLIENAVIIPIYVFPYTVATQRSVQGFKFNIDGYPFFNDVYIEKE